MAVGLTQVLGQVPLAEAFWLLWNEVLPDDGLNQHFDRHRGRCYTLDFSFSDLVHLVCDALCQHRGRVHPTLTRHAESEICPASEQAFYGKLRRMPFAVSDELVPWAAERLQPWLPANTIAKTLPTSFSGLRVLAFDSRTAKNAAKRLKPLRGKPGAALGGRTLAVLDVASGLIVGMKSHPHGHVNEQLLVPDALTQVRQQELGPCVWVADRQFGNLANFKRCTQGEEHCILRKHGRTVFRPDSNQPAIIGVDEEGRTFSDQIGVLTSTREGQQLARQITVKRKGLPDLVILTSLLDQQAFSAVDILAVYRLRWNIEESFQKVSQVFQLSYLIGSHPKAIMLQTALCLTMANVLTVLLAILAKTQNRTLDTISTAKVWYDLHRQLTTCHVLASPDEIVRTIRDRVQEIPDICKYLEKILSAGWSNLWNKSPPKKRHAKKVKHRRGGKAHFSIHKVLQDDQAKKRKGV
jgi:hypothetical protein